MLRLFPDYSDGTSELRCPVCHRRLVLAAERMGRMVITYDHGFRIRPGHPALLLCPDYDCPYREPVEIAATADDAIPFSPLAGGYAFFREQQLSERTFGEVRAELARLSALYQQTGNPKLPAAVHHWREHYADLYREIKSYLTQSFTEDKEVSLEGRDRGEFMRGKVRCLMHDAFLFERSDTGQTVLVQTDDLRSVWITGIFHWVWKPGRFDFGTELSLPKGVHVNYMPDTFVVIDGHTLTLADVTKYARLRAYTEDPAIAQALGIYNPRDTPYTGEFSLALVERCFRVVRYGWIGGHRLHVRAGSNDRSFFELVTRDMAVARSLRLNRPYLISAVRRRTLHWEGIFPAAALDRLEEVAVDVRLPRGRRR